MRSARSLRIVKTDARYLRFARCATGNLVRLRTVCSLSHPRALFAARRGNRQPGVIVLPRRAAVILAALKGRERAKDLFHYFADRLPSVLLFSHAVMVNGEAFADGAKLFTSGVKANG